MDKFVANEQMTSGRR